MSYLAGVCSSVVFIYLINSTGKMNFTSNTLKLLPEVNDNYADPIIVRALRLNALTQYYALLWKEQYRKEFSSDDWGFKDSKIHSSYDHLDEQWDTMTPFYNSFERYIAFCEIDVLSAMSLELKLEQLIDLCRINYPNLLQNDENTWYDKNGDIVFTTNKSLSGVGLDRVEWETRKNTMSPKDFDMEYFRYDRISVYREIWSNLEERFKK